SYKSGETEVDKSLEKLIEEAVQQVEQAMDNMEFHTALAAIWNVISRTNKYIDENEPWILAKDDTKKDRLANVMAHLSDSLRIVGVMLQPCLVESTEGLFNQLGLTDSKYKEWDSIYKQGIIKEGTTIQKGKQL